MERANRLKKFLKPVKIKKIKTQFSLSNDIEWFPTLGKNNLYRGRRNFKTIIFKSLYCFCLLIIILNAHFVLILFIIKCCIMLMVFSELLCKSTPQLHSAIEITNFGYMYLLENDYKSAIENFMTGLNILEELMEREPPGIRYNLLTKQVSL